MHPRLHQRPALLLSSRRKRTWLIRQINTRPLCNPFRRLVTSIVKVSLLRIIIIYIAEKSICNNLTPNSVAFIAFSFVDSYYFLKK